MCVNNLLRIALDSWTTEITVKPVLFACPLFREFHDLGNLAKITGR